MARSIGSTASDYSRQIARDSADRIANKNQGKPHVVIYRGSSPIYSFDLPEFGRSVIEMRDGKVVYVEPGPRLKIE